MSYTVIDISRYQGDIDFQKVKDSNLIGGVMMRAGIGNYTTGAIREDSKFIQNANGFKSVGIPTGIYYFSQAVTEADAIMEANYCIEQARKYGATKLIAYDLEGEGRIGSVSKEQLTRNIIAFCSTVAAAGLPTCLYTYLSFLSSRVGEESIRANNIDIWIAHYTSTAHPEYATKYAMWQYTSSGTVPGIEGRVDMNHCYKDYFKGGTQSMATFVKRTTAPSSTDKNWINVAYGGYNHAIKIKSDGSVLPNCFKGDTKFVTKDGLKTLKDEVGNTVMALCRDGEYRPAEVKYFGKNELVKITFTDGHSFYTTPNHRWFITKGKKELEVTTIDLKPRDKIKYIQRHWFDNVEFERDGVRHGIVFGDGKKHNNCNTCEAYISESKKEDLQKFFPEPEFSWTKHSKNGYCITGKIPGHYKELPSMEETDAYLMGFLMGYFATDGSVGNSTYSISSVNYDHIQGLINICHRLKIKTGKLMTDVRDKVIDGKIYKNHTLYRVNLSATNLSAAMFLRENHKKEFLSHSRKNIQYTSIKSIVQTGIIDDVYCIVEPVTHTMVLEGLIGTGQCTGYVHGRWLELGLPESKLCLNNAEIYWGYNDGFPRSQTPKLGAIICWRKGAAGPQSDGAGHVAVVEEIYSDGTVLASQSNYSGTRFYTKRINPKTWPGGAYTFQGYIYPPIDFDGKSFIEPVQRDASKNQVEVAYDFLNARSNPYFGNNVIGYIPRGIYDVLATKDMRAEASNGYYWYQVAGHVWIADIGADRTIYLPATEEPKDYSALLKIGYASGGDFKEIKALLESMGIAYTEPEEGYVVTSVAPSKGDRTKIESMCNAKGVPCVEYASNDDAKDEEQEQRIKYLEEENAKLKAENETLKVAIDETEQDILSYETRINTLEKEVGTYESVVGEIETALTKLD